MTKDQILNFAKHQRDNASDHDKEYLAAIYFVLRNRTEENWGPKELTMDVAMRMTEFDTRPASEGER